MEWLELVFRAVVFLFGVGIFVVAIFGLFMAFSDGGDEGGAVAIIMVIFLIIAVSMMYHMVYTTSKGKKVVVNQPLIGVRLSLNISGGGFLTFVMETSDAYTGWIEESGGKKKYLMPMSSIVYESDNVEPHYEEKCIVKSYIFHNEYIGCEHAIYVPKNSVKAEFNIK